VSQAFGVVDVLVASQTTENRLTYEAGQFVADVPAAPTIAEDPRGEIRETENVIQFAIGEQAAVGRDASTVELELDPAIENGLQSGVFAYTLHVRHCRAASLPPSL
jgi:hypothetical protein